jgi:hypothetical protein
VGNIAKPNNPSKYHQGYYKPFNPDKYMGDPTRIAFRSSWEYKFCTFLDTNDKILKWNSEGITITYQDTLGNFHRYYPDFYYEAVNSNNPDKIDKVVVEVKPYSDTQPPKKPMKESIKSLQNFEYSLKTFMKNKLKWGAASEWCAKRGLQFIIITEKHLEKAKILK